MLLRTLLALPSNVRAVVPDIPGLVQTSNNVSTVTWAPAGDSASLTIGCLSRSSSADDMIAIVNQLRSIGELAGAEVTTANPYPGWQPDFNSTLLTTGKAVYERLFNEPPSIEAVHAGLECGIIMDRVPGVEAISIGPTIRNAHSPTEFVYVDSVQRSYDFLVALLAALLPEG
jgi:dipeptidase D